MESNSPQNDIYVLESEIRETYGRIVYSHKTQEKCADIINKNHHWIKVLLVILSALTTGGILIALITDKKIFGVISALISGIQFGLNAYTKDYNLGEIAQKHAQAANELLEIRDKYISFLANIKAKHLNVEQVSEERDRLQVELFKIYKSSPRTFSKAYIMAQKALQKMEEMTFSDSEIDKFLPKALRRSQTCN